MAWNGLHIYDGTEFINSERTEALAGPQPWFRPLPELSTESGTLSLMFDGDQDYTDPTLAPWYDVDVPASARFYGAYPLDISGTDSSTRGSTPFEGVTDGGTPGRIRHGLRSIVYSVALMAADEEAADYGFKWLKRVLLGAKDSRLLTTRVATGLTLRYLSAKPVLGLDNSAIERTQTLSRRLNRVTIASGPTEPAKKTISCGGAVWVTQFTATAGNPFEIGNDRLIFTGMPLAPVYGPGITTGVTTGIADYTEVDCSATFPDPLYDPACQALIDPPAPPSVPLGCYELPAVWKRYKASIPADEVPAWGQVVPTVDIFTTVAQNGIRIRFYEDIDGDLDVTEDPCNFVGDMLVSYIPAGATMRLDGVNERIAVSLDGIDRRADSLAYGSDFKPFTWPTLTRGNQWVMVIDFDDTTPVTRPQISLTLTPRAV